MSELAADGAPGAGDFRQSARSARAACGGLGTPLVALVSDPRKLRFLGEAGLREFAIDIHDPDLAARTYDLLTRVLDKRAAVRCKLMAARQFMRKQTLAFSRRVGALFES